MSTPCGVRRGASRADARPPTGGARVPHVTRGTAATLFLLAAVVTPPAAQAHELRPAYLEIRAVDGDTFDVLWKVPARGEYRLSLHAQLPKECSGAPSHGSFVGAAYVERWRARCPGGLIGRTIGVDGLSATRTDVLVRIEWTDGTTHTARLTPEQTSFGVTAAPGALAVARTYAALGVEHILLGVDHLLFVLGLLFLVGDWRQLVGTITAFTLAHSLTLAAATLDYVHVPQAPVEATIALSVMFLAAEIVHGAQGRAGLAARAPWLIAFVFGLLHGFGFSGALREIGLPQRDIPLALFAFNVGVEIGQLTFIALVVAVFSAATRLVGRRGADAHGPWYAEAMIRTPVAYAIGSIAAFWTVQRVVGFWP